MIVDIYDVYMLHVPYSIDHWAFKGQPTQPQLAPQLQVPVVVQAQGSDLTSVFKGHPTQAQLAPQLHDPPVVQVHGSDLTSVFLLGQSRQGQLEQEQVPVLPHPHPVWQLAATSTLVSVSTLASVSTFASVSTLASPFASSFLAFFSFSFSFLLAPLAFLSSTFSARSFFLMSPSLSVAVLMDAIPTFFPSGTRIRLYSNPSSSLLTLSIL